jgi:hypothetical protein
VDYSSERPPLRGGPFNIGRVYSSYVLGNDRRHAAITSGLPSRPPHTQHCLSLIYPTLPQNARNGPCLRLKTNIPDYSHLYQICRPLVNKKTSRYLGCHALSDKESRSAQANKNVPCDKYPPRLAAIIRSTCAAQLQTRPQLPLNM